MKLRAVAAPACLLVLATAACTDLPRVEETGCGNLVINEDEDCDGFAPLGEDTRCADPGEAHECRYVCDAAEGVVCPEGWGCGQDGLCLRATGDFAPAPGTPWRFRVSDFAVGDVDGDGNVDVIGHDVSSLLVRFGSETGELASEADFVTRPSTGHVSYGFLNADSLLDVVIPIAEGLFVLLGQEDRTLEPVAYQPFALPAAADLTAAPVESDSSNLVTELLVVAGPDMEFLGSNAEPVKLPNNHLAGDIAGHIPAAELDPPDAGLRQEYAISFTGASGVWIYTSVGDTFNLLRPSLKQLVALQGGAGVDEGTRFADVNGDGYPDLMVSVRDALDEQRVAVSLNDGTGNLESVATVRAVFDRQLTSPWPLAAGDLDGDGKADYVMPEAILISDFTLPDFVGLPATLTPTAFMTTQPWSEAALGDFNGDGYVDVAIGIDGRDGVDFFLNAHNSDFFNKFHVDTAGPPLLLRVGDFDGDFIADVAFSESGLGSEPDNLAVIYGGTAGGPTAPASMGSMGYIELLESFSMVTTLESLDVINDLLVVSKSFPDRENYEVAIMLGNSSRRILSPFTLQPESEADDEDPDVPRWALFGQFVLGESAENNPRDVVAIADKAIDLSSADAQPAGADGPQVKESRVWLVPGKGNDGQLDGGTDQGFDLPAFADFDTRCAVWTAGDLDPTGSDDREEVVGIDNDASCYGRGDSPASRLLVAGAAGAPGEGIAIDVNDLGVDARVVQEIWLRDLDDDGDLDLLALFVGEYRLDQTDTTGNPFEGAALVIVWNDGDQLQVADIDEIVMPEGTNLLDVAPMNLDTDPRPELAILTAAGGYAADFDPESGSYQLLDVDFIPDVRNGRLEVADFNRDGLDDLAITDAEDLYVILAKGAGPLGPGGVDSSTDGENGGGQ